jgi:hypothetical protein
VRDFTGVSGLGPVSRLDNRDRSVEIRERLRDRDTKETAVRTNPKEEPPPSQQSPDEEGTDDVTAQILAHLRELGLCWDEKAGEFVPTDGD